MLNPSKQNIVDEIDSAQKALKRGDKILQIKHYHNALIFAKKIYGDFAIETASVYDELGRAYLGNKDFKEAAEAAKSATEIGEYNIHNNPHDKDVRTRVANMYRHYAKALGFCSDAAGQKNAQDRERELNKM